MKELLYLATYCLNKHDYAYLETTYQLLEKTPQSYLEDDWNDWYFQMKGRLKNYPMGCQITSSASRKLQLLSTIRHRLERDIFHRLLNVRDDVYGNVSFEMQKEEAA